MSTEPRTPLVIYSVVLGSGIFILYKTLLQAYFDWQLNVRPESFYERNILGATVIFLLFLPVHSLNALMFVSLVNGVSSFLKKGIAARSFK